MQYLTYNSRELLVETLPDGVVSTLSNHSLMVNNMVYYDQESMKKIKEFLLINEGFRLHIFYQISHLQGAFSLQKLYLRDDLIGDTGAVALGEALKVNESLQKLWLNDNPIGDAGAEALRSISNKRIYI